MCLIEGLADGRYLEDNELLPEHLAVEGAGTCLCTQDATFHHDAYEPPREGGMSRRSLLGRSALALAGVGLGKQLLGAPLAGAAESASVTGDRLVMLGVNGGPILSPVHSQPSVALIIDDVLYLIDAGSDAPRQLVTSGLGFRGIRHIFLTHHHLDHVAGYPLVAMMGWCYGPAPLPDHVSVWGAPPLARMTTDMFATYREGVNLFRDTGPAPPSPEKRFFPHEVQLPPRNKNGAMTPVKIMEDPRVKVHATRVYHGPEVKGAYAYRFDVKSSGKSVVFSGDVGGPDKNLIALAADADLLVHEVQMNSALPKLVAAAAPSVRSKAQAHLEDIHTDVADLPRIAKAANVKRVAMCHYVPSFIPAEAFLKVAKQAAVGAGFGGEIIAPEELDQIPV